MKKFILYFQGLDIYYVKEDEFLSKLLKNNSKEIIFKLLKIFKFANEYYSYDFSEEDDIMDYNNYNYQIKYDI